MAQRQIEITVSDKFGCFSSGNELVSKFKDCDYDDFGKEKSNAHRIGS